MKDLSKENTPLKRLVASLSLEKQLLKDLVSGNLYVSNGVNRRLGAAGESATSRKVTPAGLSAKHVVRSVTQ